MAVLPAIVLALVLLGALLLVIAEFSPLYTVNSPGSARALETVSTHSHDAFALTPLALLAMVFGFVAWRTGSRTALAGIGVLGVAALLIALIGDLPDAHASGLIGSAGTRYELASSSASAGLYVETLGAILLIVAAGVGLIVNAPARPEKMSVS